MRFASVNNPMNHQEPNVQKQPSKDLTRERQLGNQARERAVERADEPPTQHPRLENPASSLRWSSAGEPRHWVPATTTEDEEDMWTETDPKNCGSSKSTIAPGRTMGSTPVCVKKSGMSSSAIPVKT